jgi:hypothetical protein
MNTKTFLQGLVIAIIIASLISLLRYQSSHSKIEVIEVMQNLKMSTLLTKNTGCYVTNSEGAPIALHEGEIIIPKGSYITSECFNNQSK